MATVRPFRGLRYTPATAPLSDLVAPPYDVLSPEERDRYAAKHPENVVWMTLPEQLPDDRSKYVKYARSAARLEALRRDGKLARDEAPSFYRLTQTFEVPGATRPLVREALVALIKVEPYSAGVVLPHEQTFPKHKEDRLRILEATRAHLECIYGLYEDDGGDAYALVHGAPGEPVGDVTTEDGVRHRIERVSDPEANSQIAGALASRKVWIADGHHRYETAQNFRASLGDRPGEVAEDFMLMALSSIADPGLVILPTHRILHTAPCDLEERLKAGPWTVHPCPNEGLPGRIQALAGGTRRAFGVALPSGEGMVLEIADAAPAAARTGASDLLRGLDVTILHETVFAATLGLTGHEFFGYTRDPEEAIAAVRQGAPASFLMNPPTVDDMRRIALGGEKMPQKSTYYYPKIISGLVLWSLNDF
jgi:uncharacterized protein (DUF1015 family)